MSVRGVFAFLALAMLVCSPDALFAVPRLVPYGFVRMDAVLIDSPMNHPQFSFWVESEKDVPDSPEDIAKDKGEFNLYPRLTRLGVSIEPTKIWDNAEIAGRVEVDFQNGGKESRALLRWRHAYFTVSRGTWEILAGETWDLIAPLYPFVNSDGMMWNAGNLGDRRPQVRISARPQLGAGIVRLSVAAGMPNAVNAQDLDGNGVVDGAFAMLPAVQGLAEIDLPWVKLGGWVHFQRDRVQVEVSSPGGGTSIAERDYDAIVFGGHARVPLGKRLVVLGEGFKGQNASDVRGGIGQGINLEQNRTIRTVGGWAELKVQTTGRWTVAAGATLDDPKDDDLLDGSRSYNQTFYGAVRVQPAVHLKIAAEYIYWTTEYKNAPKGVAGRMNVYGTMTF